MKRVTRAAIVLAISFTAFFAASTYTKPKKFHPQYSELKKRILELNKEIRSATIHKAYLQKERDMLLRQLKLGLF